jgi:hypothetical protein
MLACLSGLAPDNRPALAAMIPDANIAAISLFEISAITFSAVGGERTASQMSPLD